MQKIFFTPGPTQLHPAVKPSIDKAIEDNILSLNHRSAEFVNVYRSTAESLRKLLNIPDSNQIFFMSSATECMERIIQNTVESRSFHFVNGAFAERFYKISNDLNKSAMKAEVEYGKGFDFDNIKISNDPELITVTQNETSTGVSIDPEKIYELKKNFPDAIVAVDIVTSAPYSQIDYSKIDCAFFSVQKGFGLPAGLGVLILNEACIERARTLKAKGIQTGSYNSFISLFDNAVKNETPVTPNELGIYLLGKISDELIKEGIDKIRTDTEIKAKMLYEYFDNHNRFKPFVSEISDRSRTIINIDTLDNQAEVKKKLAAAGIMVGSGYGKLKEKQIRIANFPMHTIDGVKRIIESV